MRGNTIIEPLFCVMSILRNQKSCEMLRIISIDDIVTDYIINRRLQKTEKIRFICQSTLIPKEPLEPSCDVQVKCSKFEDLRC